MSVYLIETWHINPENEKEHEELWRQFINFMEQYRELFKEITSMKLYKKLPSSGSPTHAQVMEFPSIEAKLSLDKKLINNKTCAEFSRNLARLKDSKTITEIVCQTFLEYE